MELYPLASLILTYLYNGRTYVFAVNGQMVGPTENYLSRKDVGVSSILFGTTFFFLLLEGTSYGK